MRADNIQKTIESQIADLQDQLHGLRGNLGARGSDMYDQANEQARLAMLQMRRQAAKVGKVARDNPPGMGSEDFSLMMEKVPGAYIHVGNGDGAMPHNPRYAFNDEAIPYGAALYARIVERGLPKG